MKYSIKYIKKKLKLKSLKITKTTNYSQNYKENYFNFKITKK